MSFSAFEALTNEEVEDADPVQHLHYRDFSIEELKRHCIEYHLYNNDYDWEGIVYHIKAALGYKEHEQQILTLPLAQHTIHLSNALQAYADDVQVSDPTHARRALRLLVKHVKRGGQMPHNTFTSDPFVVHETDVVRMGGFSDVFRVRSKDGSLVALKRIRLVMNNEDRQDIIRRFCREALIWRQLKHQFVLPFIGVDCLTFNDYPCLISPWMPHGTLLDFVRQDLDNGSERLRLIYESACGVDYLHKSGVVHGDLRAANIFVNDDLCPQLADFGLSVMGDTMTAAATGTANQDGSTRWMAPELHDPESFGVEFKRTQATDMYAFGGLALEVITGLEPFSDVRSNTSVLMKILKGIKPAQWPLAHGKPVPRAVWGEIDRCWSTDASGRPSAYSLMKILEDQSPSITNEIHRRAVQEQRAFKHIRASAESINGESLDSGHSPTQPTARGSKRRQQSQEDAVAGKRQRKAERSEDSRMRSKIGQQVSLVGINPNDVPLDLKKEGEDWFAVWNPDAKRRLDVELLYTLEHNSTVHCVRFSADGKQLATGCQHSAQIFDVQTGVKVCELIDEAMPEDHAIWSMCLSPDGKFLATGGSDVGIRIWNIAQKKIAKIFDVQGRVSSLEFSRDGQLLVSGSEDWSIGVWDMSTPDSGLMHIVDTDASVNSVAISPDGRLVATSPSYSVVSLLDVQSGTVVEELYGHETVVTCVAFTPDGRGLVSGSWDETLRYWDIRAVMARVGGRRDPALKYDSVLSGCTMEFLGHESWVSSVAISADGQWVVSGSDDYCVQIWDAHTATAQLMLWGHGHYVNSVDVNPVGGMLASGGDDKRVRIWKYTAM